MHRISRLTAAQLRGGVARRSNLLLGGQSRRAKRPRQAPGVDGAACESSLREHAHDRQSTSTRAKSTLDFVISPALSYLHVTDVPHLNIVLPRCLAQLLQVAPASAFVGEIAEKPEQMRNLEVVRADIENSTPLRSSLQRKVGFLQLRRAFFELSKMPSAHGATLTMWRTYGQGRCGRLTATRSNESLLELFHGRPTLCAKVSARN